MTEAASRSRADALRRQNRRIYFWSFGVAVVAHLLLIFFGPWFRTGPGSIAGTELVEGGEASWGGLPITVFFGPPAIVSPDGSLSQQPEERTLSATRKVPIPVGCASNDWWALDGVNGRVRLLVNARGRIDDVELTESTGDICWDGILTAVAGDLLFRWLPSESHPAPVEVRQPVALTLMQ